GALHRHQAREKRTVSLQSDPKILSRHLIAAPPHSFQLPALIRIKMRNPLDGARHKLVRLLERFARLVHKARLNRIPAGLELFDFTLGEKCRLLDWSGSGSLLEWNDVSLSF